MEKNVLIFSDGTGQVGGIKFDEDRTNIYKLYRATRVGPTPALIRPNKSRFMILAWVPKQMGGTCMVAWRAQSIILSAKRLGSESPRTSLTAMRR